MNKLVESILSQDLVSANEMFSETMNEIVEQKFYEIKRSIELCEEDEKPLYGTKENPSKEHWAKYREGKSPIGAYDTPKGKVRPSRRIHKTGAMSGALTSYGIKQRKKEGYISAHPLLRGLKFIDAVKKHMESELSRIGKESESLSSKKKRKTLRSDSLTEQQSMSSTSKSKGSAKPIQNTNPVKSGEKQTPSYPAGSLMSRLSKTQSDIEKLAPSYRATKRKEATYRQISSRLARKAAERKQVHSDIISKMSSKYAGITPQETDVNKAEKQKSHEYMTKGMTSAGQAADIQRAADTAASSTRKAKFMKGAGTLARTAWDAHGAWTGRSEPQTRAGRIAGTAAKIINMTMAEDSLDENIGYRRTRKIRVKRKGSMIGKGTKKVTKPKPRQSEPVEPVQPLDRPRQ